MNNHLLMLKSSKFSKLLIPFFEMGAKAISFVVIILLTRIISIEDYGVYNFSIAIASWFTVFSDFGIGWFTFNNAVKSDKALINLSINSRLIQSLLILLVVPLLFYENRSAFLITFLVTFFFLNTGFVKFLQTIFRGFGQSKNDVILAGSEPFLRLIFLAVVYFYKIEMSLLGICISFSIIGLFLTTAFLTINSKKIDYRIFFPTIKEYLGLLNKTKLYFLYQFFQVGIARLDIFFIEKYLGVKDVAVYSSALNIYGAFTLFFLAVITVNLKSLLIKMKTKYFLMILLGGILTALAYHFYFIGLFNIIYPVEYNPGAILVTIFILALPFYIGYQVISFSNNYNNRTKYTVITFGTIFCLKLMTYFIFSVKTVMMATLIFSSFELLTFAMIFIFNRFGRYESTTDK